MGVGLSVTVGLGVVVGVRVGVLEGVRVGVIEGVFDGVAVGVRVADGVGVPVLHGEDDGVGDLSGKVHGWLVVIIYTYYSLSILIAIAGAEQPLLILNPSGFFTVITVSSPIPSAPSNPAPYFTLK